MHRSSREMPILVPIKFPSVPTQTLTPPSTSKLNCQLILLRPMPNFVLLSSSKKQDSSLSSSLGLVLPVWSPVRQHERQEERNTTHKKNLLESRKWFIVVDISPGSHRDKQDREHPFSLIGEGRGRGGRRRISNRWDIVVPPTSFHHPFAELFIARPISWKESTRLLSIDRTFFSFIVAEERKKLVYSKYFL